MSVNVVWENDPTPLNPKVGHSELYDNLETVSDTGSVALAIEGARSPDMAH